MFEGQRLSYVVPGYTGYLFIDSDTSPKKFTKNSKESRSKMQCQRFQVMQDTFPLSNQKIYMEKLSARPHLTSEIQATSRDKTMKRRINTSRRILPHTSPHLKDCNALLQILLECRIPRSLWKRYIFKHSAHHPTFRKRSRSIYPHQKRRSQENFDSQGHQMGRYQNRWKRWKVIRATGKPSSWIHWLRQTSAR